MKTFFGEATDKRLLEAKSEEEVKAIIAGTPEAEKLADKIDLVMAELARIKGLVDNELDIDELDSAAGGAKVKDVYLSETQSCIATFFLQDLKSDDFCWSDDQCGWTNEYLYHNTRYSNCKKGGRHSWQEGEFKFNKSQSRGTTVVYQLGYKCAKCGIIINANRDNFNK